MWSLSTISRGWPDAVKWGPPVEGDILDSAAVASALDRHRPDQVAHFTAVVYVDESVMQPSLYYHNNCVDTLTLLDELRESRLNRIIFSSTCASYGVPVRSPIDEGVVANGLVQPVLIKLFKLKTLAVFGLTATVVAIASRSI
jgi:UDP-arabinose 4-epimerase